MGRKCRARRSMSFYIDNEIADELEKCSNMSEVVNQILAENAGQIGYFTKRDGKRIVRELIEERIREHMPKLMKVIVEDVLNEFQLPEEE